MQHSRWPSPYSSVTPKKCASPSTPPKFNIAPENDGWKMSFLLGLPIFRFHVELRGVMDHCSLWICQKKSLRWQPHDLDEQCWLIEKARTAQPWRPDGWRRSSADRTGVGGGKKGSNKVREKSTPQKMIHPGRLTRNLQITYLERKIIFQTSMIMFHVNLPGCTFWWKKSG